MAVHALATDLRYYNNIIMYLAAHSQYNNIIIILKLIIVWKSMIL